MTPRLARELTSQENSHTLLLKLTRQNYFLETRFTPDLSYQYHPLFREFLLAKAEGMLAPAQVKDLQHRAADLLDAHGHIDEAAQICSEIGAYEKLAQLTCMEAPHLIRQGRSQTLERRLNVMPEKMIEKNAWLLFWKGVCLQSRAPVEGRSYFEKAYRLFMTRPGQNLEGLYLCLLNCIDTFYLARGRVEALAAWVKKLEDVMKLYPKAPSKEIEERIIFSLGGAIILYLPQHPGFSQWRKKLEAFIYSGADATMRMMTGFWFITYYVRTGEYAKVKIILDRLKPDIDLSHLPPMLVIIWHEWQAAYNMVSGRSDECQKCLEKAFRIAKHTGIHIWDSSLFEFGIYNALSSGDFSVAKDYLEKNAPIAARGSLYDKSQYYYLLAWKTWLDGRLFQAVEHSQKALDLALTIGDPFIIALSHLGLALVLFESWNQSKASSHLTKGLRICRQRKFIFHEYKCLLTKAHFAFSLNKKTQGLRYLKKALTLGREKRFLVLDFMHPSIMTTLFAKALDAGIETDYVHTLIRALKVLPETPPLECERWPWILKIFTLGRFSLVKEGKPVRFPARAQKKTLDMLKLIICLGGRNITKEQISYLLWPESDGDMAHQAFTVTLHRLRQLLGTDKALLLREGRLSLDSRYCWVDAWTFERLCGQADKAFDQGNNKEGITLCEKALSIYLGPLFPEVTLDQWSIPQRDRLRSKFIRAVEKLSAFFEESGKYKQAITYYKKALEIDDLAEAFYQHKMQCLMANGQRAEALVLYHRCKKRLSHALGIPPSPKTEALYQRLMAKSD